MKHIMKVRRVNRNTGSVSIHFLKVERIDGKVKRKYISKSELEKTFVEATRWWIDRTILLGTRKYDKMISSEGKEIRANIESLGLTMRSRRRMCRSRKHYLTIEAARNRFMLLDDELRTMVQTPENLLLIDKRSDSIIHSMRARGKKKVTAHDCFMQALDEYLRGEP